MSRVFITGSADGLGRLAAESLISEGHQLVVHARNDERATALAPLVQQGADVVVADLSDRDQVLALGHALADAEPFDAVIHNAGVWSGRAVMPVNVIAPYLLTALMPLPRRLVYLSSASHYGGEPRTEVVDWLGRRPGSYADSKLCVTTLMAAIARMHPEVLANAVDPGWVPTRMGGTGAPDDLGLGHQTQEWLATSDDTAALTSGGYWYHGEKTEPHGAVNSEAFQSDLLQTLADETGTKLL
jgi:NAD(P)-dependent dehydrogenase (short-subunit alcohol dehydrogenase family)